MPYAVQRILANGLRFVGSGLKTPTNGLLVSMAAGFTTGGFDSHSKMGRTPSERSGILIGLEQRFTLAVFRILALVMIGVLLQTVFLPANCMAITTQKPGTAVASSQDGPDDTEGDAGCCSYCFCCHFTGVLNSDDLSLALVANGFLAPTRNPLPLQLSISPLDQPPRA